MQQDDLYQWRYTEFRRTLRGDQLPEDCTHEIFQRLNVYDPGPICALCKRRECRPEEYTSGWGAVCSHCWGVW